MAKLNTEQFRQIVIDDIQGKRNPNLKNGNVIDLWLAHLYDIKAETETRILLLDDAQQQQGAMNRPAAAEKAGSSIKKTEAFLKNVEKRIEEAEVIAAFNKTDPAPEEIGFNLANFNALKAQNAALKTRLGKIEDANKFNAKTIENLLKTLKTQKENSRAVFEKTVADMRTRLENEKQRWTGSIRKENDEKLALTQLLRGIVQKWEDGVVGEADFEEVRVGLNWSARPVRAITSSISGNRQMNGGLTPPKPGPLQNKGEVTPVKEPKKEYPQNKWDKLLEMGMDSTKRPVR